MSTVQEFCVAPEGIDADFCYEVTGDGFASMHMPDGSTVFVKACDELVNGDVAVLLLDDTVMMYLWYQYKDFLVLSTPSWKHKEVMLPVDSPRVKILGKVVSVQTRIRGGGECKPAPASADVEEAAT